MKKALSLSLVLAMTLSLLAGCGSDTAEETTVDQPTSTATAVTEQTSGEKQDASGEVITTTSTSEEPDGIVAGSEMSCYINMDATTLQMPGQAPAAAWMYAISFDTLFYSPSGNYDDIEGLLVKDWEVSEDGLSWTLNLHEDVYFVNGVNMTAESVAGTFDLHTSISTPAVVAISSYEVTGEYQITLHYDAPNAELMYQFSFPQSGIFDPTACLADGISPDAMYMAGSGPYYISDYAIGDYVTYTAHENYWNEDRMPHIETINMKIILDSNTQTTALLSGESMFGQLSDYSAYETVLAAGDISTYQAYGMNSPIWINASGVCPYLSNARVREALGMMINMDDVVLAATGGYGELAPNSFNDGVAYTDNRTYDPEAGLAILAEEGVDPSDIVLTASCEVQHSGIFTSLQAQFAAVGITLDFVAKDYPAVMSAIISGDWDLLVSHGGLNRFSFSSPIYSLVGEGGSTNVCRDPEVQAEIYDLCAEALSQMTYEDQMDKIAEIAQVLDENYIYIGNIRQPNFFAYSTELENVVFDGCSGYWMPWYSWLAE